MGEFVHGVEPQPVVQRHRGQHAPLVLHVDAVQPARLVLIVDDVRAARPSSACRSRPPAARSEGSWTSLPSSLRQECRAERVLLVDAPASVRLDAGRHVRARRLLRDAIEQQIADRVGRKCQRLVRLKTETCMSRVSTMLLQRQHGEIGVLALRLVQVGTVEGGRAVHGKPEGRLAGIVGNLELPSKPPRIRLTRVSGSMMPDR